MSFFTNIIKDSRHKSGQTIGPQSTPQPGDKAQNGHSEAVAETGLNNTGLSYIDSVKGSDLAAESSGNMVSSNTTTGNVTADDNFIQPENNNIKNTTLDTARKEPVRVDWKQGPEFNGDKHSNLEVNSETEQIPDTTGIDVYSYAEPGDPGQGQTTADNGNANRQNETGPGQKITSAGVAGNPIQNMESKNDIINVIQDTGNDHVDDLTPAQDLDNSDIKGPGQLPDTRYNDNNEYIEASPGARTDIGTGTAHTDSDQVTTTPSFRIAALNSHINPEHSANLQSQRAMKNAPATIADQSSGSDLNTLEISRVTTDHSLKNSSIETTAVASGKEMTAEANTSIQRASHDRPERINKGSNTTVSSSDENSGTNLTAQTRASNTETHYDDGTLQDEAANISSSPENSVIGPMTESPGLLSQPGGAAKKQAEAIPGNIERHSTGTHQIQGNLLPQITRDLHAGLNRLIERIADDNNNQARPRSPYRSEQISTQTTPGNNSHKNAQSQQSQAYIGQIDITVLAPEKPVRNSVPTPVQPASSLASRLYLRNF